MDSPESLLINLRDACEKLNASTLKERTGSIEYILKALRNKDLIKLLHNENEWRPLCKSVKTLLYKELDKLQDKITAGKENSRSKLYPCEIRDLFYKIVKLANNTSGQLEFDEYMRHIKKCWPKSVYRDICFSKGLLVLEQNFLQIDRYYFEMTIEILLDVMSFFKEAYKEDPSNEILKCYVTCFEKSMHYNFTLAHARQEVPFMKQVVIGFKIDAPRALLDTGMKMWVIFCRMCGSTYKELCVTECEPVLRFLFPFITRNKNDTQFCQTLLQLWAVQLDLHADTIAPSEMWQHVVCRLAWFINHWMDTNDRWIVSETKGDGLKFNDDFVHVAIACYKQYVQNMRSMKDNSNEQGVKRPRMDATFVEVIAAFNETLSRIDSRWILLFSFILEKHPECIDEEQFYSHLKLFANYVKDCTSIEKRGYALRCLTHLLNVEEMLRNSNKEMPCVDSTWIGVYDSALRTVGLNQNINESNQLLRALMSNHRKLITSEQATKLLNLYCAATLQIGAECLETFHVLTAHYAMLDNAYNVKTTIINYILQENRKSYSYLGTPICAEMLLQLTLKYGTSATSQPVAVVVNADMQTVLIEALTKIVDEFVKSDDPIAVLDCLMGLMQLAHKYRTYNLLDGEKAVMTLLKPLLDTTWKVMQNFITHLQQQSTCKSDAVFSSLLRCMQFDSGIDDVLKHSMRREFLEAVLSMICEIESNSLAADDVNMTIRFPMMRILVAYAYKADTEPQIDVQLMLHEFEYFDARSEVDYMQATIIFEGLANAACTFVGESFDHLLNLLKTISQHRCGEYRVVANLLHVQQTMFAHLKHHADLSATSLQGYFALLSTYHNMRYNFGSEVWMNLVRCYNTLIEVDETLAWAQFKDKPFVLDLPEYLDSKHVDIHSEVVKGLALVFEHRQSVNAQVNEIKAEVFKKIVHSLEIILPEDAMDRANFKALALNVFSRIIIVAKGDTFTKKALGELLMFAKKFNITTDQMKRVLEEIRVKEPCFNVIDYLQLLLRVWTQKYSILQFPHEIVNCATKKEFYMEHLPVIMPFVLGGAEKARFETICKEVDKPSQEVLRESFPKFITTKLIGHIADSKLDRTNVLSMMDTTLAAIQCEVFTPTMIKQLLRDYVDEVIVEVLKNVHDVEHFRCYLSLARCIQSPEGNEHISAKTFCTVILPILSNILERDLMHFVCYPNPRKLQQILFKLKQNVWQYTNVDDILLEFHRYALFVQRITKLGPGNDLMMPFIVRDIIYTHLLLLKKHADDSIQEVVLTHFDIFMTFLLPAHAAYFTEFVVVTCSTLVQYAEKEQALKILSQIILSNDENVRCKLSDLDPLPANNHRLDELRKHHMSAFKQQNSVEDEIKSFLKAQHVKECRVGGLKHLQQRLREDIAGLRQIYENLREMHGTLHQNKDSILHSLICTLVKLVRSKNQEESMEATKCLGILGARDLTTLVLQSDDRVCVSSRQSSSCLFTSKVIELLFDYLVDADMDVAQHAAEALVAILKTTEGHQVLNANFLHLKPYLLPFVTNKKLREISLLVIVAQKYTETLRLNELLNPVEGITHDEWIIRLATRILSGFDKRSYMAYLIPIVAAKPRFAEECVPLLMNLLIDVSEPTKLLIGLALATFFANNATLQQAGNCTTAAMNKASVKCVLDILHVIRLQRIYEIDGKIHDIDLELNYLHIAQAALYCSAHFTAIMYAEKWFQSVRHEEMHQSTNDFSSVNFFDNTQEGSAVFLKIMLQAYKDIGDTDALHGKHLERIDTAIGFDLLRLDSDFPNGTNANLTLCLKQYALYNTALSTYKPIFVDDTYYECLWRTSKWDLPAMGEKNVNFEYNIYQCLNALRDSDELNLALQINTAREQTAESLKIVSMQSCKTLYEPLAKLERLQELEDICGVAHLDEEDLQALAKKLAMRDNIPSDFVYYEPRVAQRIAAIGLLDKRERKGAAQLHIDLRLDLAEFARISGNLLIAKQIINSTLGMQLDEHDTVRAALVDAQIKWQLGDVSSLNALKQLLRTYPHCNRERALLLKLCGEWLTQKRGETPTNILTNYLIPSINILNEKSTSSAADDQLLHHVHKVLATFADTEYQRVNKFINSPEFQSKVKAVAAMKTMAAKLKKDSQSSKDVHHARLQYERFTKIDENEIEQNFVTRNHFLHVAMKYYLYNMRYSVNEQVDIFRVVSLWLDHRDMQELIDEIKQSLFKVETYKILPILPQLVPHISTDTDVFTENITLLIEKCAKDHPHHAIPLILAVAKTNADDAYTRSTVRTASNESRIDGAKRLLARLARDTLLRNIIEENFLISDAILEFAYYTSRGADARTLKIKGKSKILALRNMSYALLPTHTLRVQPNKNYESHLVRIGNIRPEYFKPGGQNAPKRIECVGSDGRVRYMLVKGSDDPRQDAVMQQVFGIMNELLRASKETQHLQIRTYKVVPQSKRCGVLEWVSNTMTMGELLVDAHKHYHPREMQPEAAKVAIGRTAGLSPAQREKEFHAVCERITPVFHKFFETSFLEPTMWFEKRRTYTQSVAASSMCGYVLGLGDRHVQNILVDKATAELIHIDFGIAFDLGQVLPTPEKVPFRLTRDIIDGMGVCGVEGVFRRSCEKTLDALWRNSITIETILGVLLYDPLYTWTITHGQAYSKQMDGGSNHSDFLSTSEDTPVNVSAERALQHIHQKLKGQHSSNVETQVDILIQQAKLPANLAVLYHGWQAFL